MPYIPDEPVTEEESGPQPVQHVVAFDARQHSHRWRQQGHTVHCESCPFTHGFNIEPTQHLTGIDDNGYPILSTISVKEAQDVR